MAALTPVQTAMVGRLAAGCPEPMLAALVEAVGAMPGARAAAMAKALNAALTDRRRMTAAFNGLNALFQPRTDGVEGLGFPPGVATALWAQAVGRAPDALEALDAPETAPAAAETLCRAAWDAVRETPAAVWPGRADDASRAEGLAVLEDVLALASLARRAVDAAPAWLGRAGEAQKVELRLMLRDADSLRPQGGRRLIEIVAAHLAEPWCVLRILVLASPSSARGDFLAGSELAGLVDRLLDAAERRGERLAAGLAGDDVAALEADAAWTAAVLSELDVTVAPAPEDAWARRARRLRTGLGQALACRLREIEASVAAITPTARLQLAGRMTRLWPDTRRPVAPDARARAEAGLAVLAALRTTAAAFGCESERRALHATLTTRFAVDADETLGLLHAGEADRANALDRVEMAGDLLAVMGAEVEATAVRRRLAATRAASEDAKAGSHQAA